MTVCTRAAAAGGRASAGRPASVGAPRAPARRRSPARRRTPLRRRRRARGRAGETPLQPGMVIAFRCYDGEHYAKLEVLEIIDTPPEPE